MLRNRWLLIFGGIALCAATLAGLLVFRLPDNRLNVLLITLDTTRADRVGCYGYPQANTPTLDALAASGVLFECAYTVAPLTLPAHTTALTGLFPAEHGVRGNGEGSLPQGTPTLATFLKGAGYQTGAFVAAFVLDGKFGLRQGFDIYDDDLSDGAEAELGAHAYRPGAVVVDAALHWLKGRDREPFLCWVHLFDPHYPYLEHSDRYGKKYADRPYDAELNYVDDQVQRLLAHLAQAGIADRTLVVVVGDHGEGLLEHDERSHSMQLYNSTLHVPLIVSNRAMAHGGRRVATPVSLVDLLPTILDCVNVKPPDVQSGKSLRPALAGGEISARPVYAETDEPFRAAHWSPLRVLIDGQWKYIQTPRAELYDLQADPGENHNLLEKHPERVAQMSRELEEWESQMRHRQPAAVSLSDAEKRRIESLGYASGRGNPGDAKGKASLTDVKDRLPLYHALEDAETLVEMGRYRDAIEPLSKIVRQDDGYFRAHSYLGLCLLQEKRYDEAIKHLRRSLELDPDSARVQATLGAALLQANQPQEAIDALEAALRLDPALYQAQFNLGMACEKRNKIPDAIEHYTRCLEIAPEFQPARQRLHALTGQ